MLSKRFLSAITFISIIMAINIAGYLYFAKKHPVLAQITDCSQANILCVDDTVGLTQEYSTIQAAVNVAIAGDTILVKEGVYSERVNLKNLNGAPGNYITIKGESGAVLDGNGTLQSLFYSYGGGAWFIIDGFEIKQSYSDGSIFLQGAHDIIIRNNVIHDTVGGAEGIYMQPGSYNILIEGNQIYNIVGKEGIYASCPGSSCSPSYNITIKNNYLHDINNEAIDLKNTYNSLIEGNIMERTSQGTEWGLGISFTTLTHDVEVRKNLFKDMGMGKSRTAGGAAIVTGDNSGGAYNNYIHHNLISGGDFAGVYLRGSNNRLEYNTITNVKLAGIDSACFVAGCNNHIIKNNLVVNVGGTEITIGPGTSGQPAISNYNLAWDTNGGNIFYAYTNAPAACSNKEYECNSISGNPLFVNSSDILGADGILWTSDDGLMILEGSPAINAGENSTDIGAYEYVEAVPPPDTTPPAPPTNLTVN